MENQTDKNEIKKGATATEIDKIVPVEVIRPYSDEQVNAHAAKCGGRRNLREISVITDDLEEFVYLVKKPSRNVLQAIAEENEKKDKKNITTIQKLMLGCVLEGDKEAYEHDGSIYTDLLKQMSHLVKTKRSEIKKI